MEAQTEMIKITGVSEYSVFAGQTRYGFNKPVNSTMFQKGHTYSVAVVTGSKGGKYISRIDSDLGVLETDANAGSVLNPELNKQTFNKKSYTPKSDMSKADWAAKDRSQLIGGRSHDAAQLVTAALLSGTPIETVVATYKSTLEQIVAMAEEVK